METVPLTFALDPAPGQALLVVTEDGDGDVDVASTLAGLRDVPRTTPILIEERYLQAQDGVGLLLRLRVEVGMEASMCPVYFRVTTSLGALVRRPLHAVVLGSKGVILLQGGQDPGEVSTPDTLDPAALLRVLESFPVRSENRSRHDMANAWGPLRLWMGGQALRPESDRDASMPRWVRASYQRLLSDEVYVYWLALADLRRRVRPARPSGASLLGKAWEDWNGFLDGHAGPPLRVLLLDDEIDRGWGDAVRSLLECPGKVEVDTAMAGVDFDAERGRVEQHALSGEWDLVLSDLRMFSDDRGESGASALGLGGAKMVRKIKAAHPETAIIAFTASNKSWSVQELRELGVDGYWTKESPELGIDHVYSQDHAAALLDAVGSNLSRRTCAGPVWALWRDLSQLANKRRYREGWAKETRRGDLDVMAVSRLDAILRRIRRAYGFLVSARSKHEEEEFELHPYDLAFLTLWGISNEVGHLYFSDPPYRRDLSAVTATFARRSPQTGRYESYWQLNKGQRADPATAVPSVWRGDLCPGAGSPHPSWPTARKDTARVAWLVDSTGDSALARRFDEKEVGGRPGLRELRNRLEDAHGDARSVEHAELDDVVAVCDVWRSLLVTPYATAL